MADLLWLLLLLDVMLGECVKIWLSCIECHTGPECPEMNLWREIMAIFSNQATLTYNGSSTNSNIAYGEILDVLVATKTAIEGSYTPGQIVTYAVTLRNTGTAPLAGLTVTDDLGGYDFNGTTVYPLTYVAGSATLFVNGVLQAAPAVTAGLLWW